MPHLNAKKNNACSKSHKMADDKSCEIFSDLKRKKQKKKSSGQSWEGIVYHLQITKL